MRREATNHQKGSISDHSMLEANRTRTHSASLEQERSPQPHWPQQRKTRHPLPILLTFLILLVLLHIIAITHTAYPTAKISNCLDLIRYTDYTKIFTSSTQTVGDVQFLDQSNNSEPAALVPVTHNGPQHLLDIYVYGCTSRRKGHPELIQLFKQQGLIQGTAVITPANTLSISTPDPTLMGTNTTTAPLQQTLQQDINREYGWHNGTFEQITFPGLFPAISRIEAEALQDQADQQQNILWSDPLKTTLQMAKELFHWSSTNITVSLQDQSATTAHVLLVQHTPYFKVAVALQRLIEPGADGLWFVTQAQTAGITLDQARLQAPIASPATIQGTITPVPGETTVTLFDHTLTPIPLLNSPTVAIQSNGAFRASFTFTNNVPDQPGLLLIEHPAPANSSAAGQLLLSSVLLN
jgi:hypothetical protein